MGFEPASPWLVGAAGGASVCSRWPRLRSRGGLPLHVACRLPPCGRVGGSHWAVSAARFRSRVSKLCVKTTVFASAQETSPAQPGVEPPLQIPQAGLQQESVVSALSTCPTPAVAGLGWRCPGSCMCPRVELCAAMLTQLPCCRARLIPSASRPGFEVEQGVKVPWPGELRA